MDPIVGLAALAVSIIVRYVFRAWVLSSDDRTSRAIKLAKAKR